MHTEYLRRCRTQPKKMFHTSQGSAYIGVASRTRAIVDTFLIVNQYPWSGYRYVERTELRLGTLQLSMRH
jgi:hypothetical protein